MKIHPCFCRFFRASAVLPWPGSTGRGERCSPQAHEFRKYSMHPLLHYCYRCNVREELPVQMSTHLSPPRVRSFRLGDAVWPAAGCTASLGPSSRYRGICHQPPFLAEAFSNVQRKVSLGGTPVRKRRHIPFDHVKGIHGRYVAQLFLSRSRPAPSPLCCISLFTNAV